MKRTNPVYKLYHSWQSHYVKSVNEGTFVNDSDEKDSQVALSESQGYGMLITMLAAKKDLATQADFNKFVIYYQQHTISKQNRLMAWKQNKSNNNMQTLTKNNTDATDGDMDIAYALLMADQKWHSTGKYNYKKLATNIVNDLIKYNYNDENELLRVGNWAKNDEKYNNLIRTSDLIPSYFKTFYELTDDKRWQKTYFKSIRILEKLSGKNKTGLIPDFVLVTDNNVSNVAPNTFESENDNKYAWNANRVPLRLAFATSNQELKKINKKILTFFNQQNSIKAVYNLDGSSSNDYSSMAFTAPIAVAAYQQKSEFQNLSEKLRKQVYDDTLSKNYYADTLKVLAALMIDNELK
ncbi:glycosyl hydrolase family 8 [Leuconostoc suionicum]|uniref:glycosyl hydrolase family 8 n=1 Tax=Leuconostoc suionicum TaxID=1511761 RepID=UPI00300CFE88